ncbi:MAG TPA: polysaccharide biosynthesis/export family protein [Bryobacteraceae bacterium]|nr:polysaccharide biosynthesis/export family protein [Bryobacteraceae bacterium]
MRRRTSWPKVVFVVVFACIPFLASAQTSSAPVPVPPPGGDTSAGANKGVATAPISKSAGAPVDSTKYKIGAADVLNVQVWHEPEFSGLMAVHEDGKFTMPLVGDLDAGGKTPVEVQEEIADSLKKYVVKPLVQVSVQDVGSKRYYMDGLIARPGEYSLIVPTTILEAISKAGGVGDFANKKHIYILRGDKRIYFNLRDVIKGKNMAQNILIQPGDHIIIP